MPTTVALVCIGDELLEGRIRDRNGYWLAKQLGKHSVKLTEIRTVPDHLSAITLALDSLWDVDYIVTSGGLGPTNDDITREALAQWLGRPLEINPEILEDLKQRFSNKNFNFTPNNRKLAKFPKETEILGTGIGTAPGFRAEIEETQILVFPGVPDEFKWFCREYLFSEFDASDGSDSTTLRFFGLGESALADRLDSIEKDAERNGFAIKYCADFPIVDVFIESPIDKPLKQIRNRVTERLSKWYIGENSSLMETTAERLLEKNATVATAESCTAGGLGFELTKVPGSSSWFDRSVVTYSNRAKVEMLDVTPETLEAEGAVSSETVIQMAEAVRKNAETDYGLSISGIAGPSGGTKDKPVGTVFFAISSDDKTFDRKVKFPDRGRDWIRRASVKMAVGMLLFALEERLETLG